MKRSTGEPCQLEDSKAGNPGITGNSALDPTVFMQLVDHCATLREFGCGLAWLVFNGVSGVNLGARQKEEVSAMHRGSRRRSELFPFSLGPLAGLKEKMLGMTLQEVCKKEFAATFAVDAFLVVSVVGLQQTSGCGKTLLAGGWSSLQKRAVSQMRCSILRMLSMDLVMARSAVEVEKELGERFMSYSGEEVPKMQQLGFSQVEKALPPKHHGGSIDLTKLVSGRTRAFLIDPRGCLLPDDGRPLPCLQAKTHFQTGDVEAVASLLVERGICDWIPFEEVITYRNQKVLNGLFAVGKGKFLEDGREIQRCIMNLIPSNSVLCKLEGAVSRLPSICQWMSITLEDDEELVFYLSDMSSAFYLFFLPEQWKPFLAFNVIVDGAV